MSIIHRMDKQGGFIVGDTATRATCYAYPTSTHATNARKFPEKVAHEMISQENKFRTDVPGFTGVENDTRNWSRLHPLNVA